MSYGLDSQGSISGRGNRSVYSTVSRQAVRHTQPRIQWVSLAVSPEVKRPGRKTDRSPPSSAEVNSGRAILPFPHTPPINEAQGQLYLFTFLK
jgi:hypothetical protein